MDSAFFDVATGKKPMHAALAALDRVAGGDENLLPALLEAVRAYATLGEMIGTLRKHFGQYRPPVVL